MDRDYKTERSTEHRAKFRADRPTEHGDYAAKKKLEIWGKAQRKSARRPKSDWGKLEWGVKFSQHQNHVARTQMHWHTPNAHCRLRVGQRERL